MHGEIRMAVWVNEPGGDDQSGDIEAAQRPGLADSSDPHDPAAVHRYIAPLAGPTTPIDDDTILYHEIEHDLPLKILATFTLNHSLKRRAPACPRWTPRQAEARAAYLE
jgi:hypothetical protein